MTVSGMDTGRCSDGRPQITVPYSPCCHKELTHRWYVQQRCPDCKESITPLFVCITCREPIARCVCQVQLELPL